MLLLVCLVTPPPWGGTGFACPAYIYPFSLVSMDLEIAKNTKLRWEYDFVQKNAIVAQLVEHSTRNGKVTGSIPVDGSIEKLKLCFRFARCDTRIK